MVYLRPETAQGIYVNYLNVLQRLPAEGAVRHRPDRQGVPQRDHPGQLHLPDPRVRADGDAVLRQAGHRRRVVRAVAGVADGVAPRRWASRPAKLRWHQHGPGELAHYAKAAYDIEYEFPFGWNEIEGIHNRTDFDLRPAPAVLRQEAGLLRPGRQRAVRALHHRDLGRRRPGDAHRCWWTPTARSRWRARPAWCSASTPRSRRSRRRCFPLVKKDGMPEIADADLPRPQAPVHLRSTTTAAPSAGGTAGWTRRALRSASRSTARRASDQTVTIRHRDAMTQDRVGVDQLGAWVSEERDRVESLRPRAEAREARSFEGCGAQRRGRPPLPAREPDDELRVRSGALRRRHQVARSSRPRPSSSKVAEAGKAFFEVAYGLRKQGPTRRPRG